MALSVSRWQTAAYAATSDLASRVSAAQPWLYVAGGVTSAPGAAPAADGTADAFQVLAGGNLGGLIAVSRMTPAAGGFGYAAANNFLHAFGGQGGSASRSIVSSELCGAGRPCAGGPSDPPDLVNWNNAGVSLVSARVNMGTGVLPGFIYLLGGFDGVAPTRSTEFVNW